jgi:glucosylceramidase
MKKLFLLGSSVFLLAAFTTKPNKSNGTATTATRTDTTPTANKKIYVYTTAQGSEKRLTQDVSLAFSYLGQPLETQPCVFIDPSKTFQTFLGIGGALTDASAETFAKLPKQQQDEFLAAYYDKDKGIGYSLARTNIHSCDFSSDSYTYVKDNDNSLSSFSVDHDRQFRIPFIKKAIAAAGGKLTLYASPWSPPAWMKTNNNMLRGGKLKKENYQTWANYFVKFIRAYEKEGIPIWGVSVQNEPMATQTWESCVFSAEDETAFLKNNLGPTLQKQGLGSKKIIVWDHNRDLLYQRASTLLNDKAAAKYAWGVGFHWYEDWSGGDQMFDNVRKVHESFPDKPLIFTEGSIERFNFDSVNIWRLGERYGRSMINDFNNGTVGWTDLNILLDEKGGPNHVQNYCYAPIIGDTRSGKLIYTNAYYYIGHLSKFIRPGAKRIECSSSRSPLLSTAFKNPDGRIVVVVMNQTAGDMPFNLWLEGKAAQTTSAAHSIMTLIF